MTKQTWAAVLVASLGYFVDIYDLILFSIVRVPSLLALGFTGQALLDKGLLLLNLQMAGMLVGGIFFGIAGDRLGRTKVLFGSIVLYSAANLLNAAVVNLPMYAVLRFIAGVGLAGELGAGITLVSEILPKKVRGLGTTLIATIGISGALLAWFVADRFDWRIAYAVGGVMGLGLLFLRVKVLESNLFEKTKLTATNRGNIFLLIKSRTRFVKYLATVCVGIPIWYIVGILITLSPEFSLALGVKESIQAGHAIFYCYFGLMFGDALSGLISQKLQSRRQSILLFLIATASALTVFFVMRGLTAPQFYLLCFILGLCAGYWAMFVTIAAEQFGTNIRATVATTVPNFVRGSLVPLSMVFAFLKIKFGLLTAGSLVGVLSLGLAFWGYTKISESYHQDLDFHD